MPVPDHLVSTDCFDTVITRALGEPRQVGYVVAARLRAAGVVDVDGEEYVEARERGEHLARRRRGPGRSLADVAAETVELLGLPATAAGDLLAAELDVEAELTREVPGSAADLAARRGGGARVAFLSDTPLTGPQLDVLLRRCGVVGEGDLVWTSSDLAAEKGEGEAYAAVVGALGGRPSRWEHRGDNRRSDVLMARLSGVEATWAPAAALTPDEHRLDAAAAATGGTSSALAGAARLARLRLAADGRGDDRTGTATAVVAPLLVGYALWALGRARAAGAPALRVVGAPVGTTSLVEVLGALAPVVAPDLRLLRGDDDAVAGEVRLHPPHVRGDAPGLRLVRDVGGLPDDGSAGWLRDDTAGTGVVEPVLDAALLVAGLAAAPHPGPGLVAAELARVLDRLPELRPGADLRGPVLRVARRLADAPTPEEARAWAGVLPAATAWPAARRAAAPRARRTVLRAADRAAGGAGLVRHKVRRAAAVLGARRRWRGVSRGG